MREGEVCEPFRIVRPLGRGGMASVYEAEELTTGNRVALKVQSDDADEELLSGGRWEREVEALRRWQHAGVVPLLDAGILPDGRWYLAMPVMKGGDLARRLAAGPLPADEAVSIVAAVAATMSEAHREGIIHRDLKPSNLLIDESGAVKVGDFGLLTLADDPDSETLTLTGQAVGSLDYTAPEQWSGGTSGPAADVYSLGVILYELLTGARPRGAFRQPSELCGSPAGLDDIIRRAMQNNPQERYRTMEEFRADLLAGWARGAAVQRWKRRSVFAACAVGIGGSAAAAAKWYHAREEGELRDFVQAAIAAANSLDSDQITTFYAPVFTYPGLAGDLTPEDLRRALARFIPALRSSRAARWFSRARQTAAGAQRCLSRRRTKAAMA
jgi:tRNA A-37 threonylcarbamoyl transferase component Bud32